MDRCTVRSLALIGTGFKPVAVTARIESRLPNMTVTGIPAAAVKEVVETVRSAVEGAGFDWPRKRVVVDIEPEGVRTRVGADEVTMAVAMAVLGATGQATPVEGRLYYGDLGMAGTLRRAARGSAAAALFTRNTVNHKLVIGPEARIPTECLPWVSTADWLRQLAEDELRAPDVLPMWGGGERLSLADFRAPAEAHEVILNALRACVRGQPLLFVGRPGMGASMLARRISTAMAPLDDHDRREVQATMSAAGFEPYDLPSRPFRAPHHSAGFAALMGSHVGKMAPGEVHIANHGVLYLDEVHEFSWAVVDAVLTAHGQGRTTKSLTGSYAPAMPAAFRLVMATDPNHAPAMIRRLSEYNPVVLRLDEIAPAFGERWAVEGTPLPASI